MAMFYDRITQFNNRVKLKQNSDGTYTLEKVEGTVYQEGTKLDAINLNLILNSIVPEGTIWEYAGDTAPQGFLFCRGQAVSRTQYKALFDVIGTAYGSGDGSTTFNLPDLRGKVPVGYKEGDTNFGTLGGSVGATTSSHNHASGDLVADIGAVADNLSTIGYNATNAVKTAYNRGVSGNAMSDIASQSVNHATTVSGNTASGSTSTLQPSTVVNFIIKYKTCNYTEFLESESTQTLLTNLLNANAAAEDNISAVNEANETATTGVTLLTNLTNSINEVKADMQTQTQAITEANTQNNATVATVTAQSNAIQTLAEENQAKIDSATIATQDQVNEINSSLEEKANLISINSTNSINDSYFGLTPNADRVIAAIEYCKNKGGGTVYLTGKEYYFDKYVNIPLTVNLCGNYARVRAAENYAGFLFGINSTDGSTWDTPFPNTYKGVIEKLVLSSYTYENTNIVKGIFCAGQYKIQDITSYGLAQTVKYANSYLDSRCLSRVTADNCMDAGLYQFDFSGLGDSVVIEEVTGTAEKILYMYACNGAKINSCILHGEIKFVDCSAISISNGHNETPYQYKFYNTTFSMRDMFMWKNTGVSPIFIYNQYGAQKPCLLENVKFIIPTYHDGIEDVDTEYEIDMNGYTPIVFRNVTKSYEHSGKVSASYEFGIKTNQGYFNNNSARNSIYSMFVPSGHIIDTWEIDTLHGDDDRYFINSLSLDSETTSLTWDKENITYYYNAILIIDNNRRLGLLGQNVEKSIEVTEGKIVKIINQDASKKYLLGNILRLYRGTATGSYSSYLDLPICGFNGSIDYDLGSTISKMFAWKDRTASGMGGVNNCYHYKAKGVNIECTCDTVPTLGKWKKGDIVYKLNPTAGDYLGWVCVTAGDFGGTAPLFKGFGMLES